MIDILETTTEMDIPPENIFKVVDSNWENIENKFLGMAEIIKPHVEPLGDNTGIGSRDGVGGVPWKALIAMAFELIDKGLIEIHYKSDIPMVNLLQIESIEIKLSKEALSDLRSLR